MNRRAVALVYLLVAGLAAGAASAATFVVPDDGVLVDRAHAIVVGTAQRSYTRLTAGGAIETITVFLVEEVIKGGAPRTIELHARGGRYGDRATIIPGMPHFRDGERSLVFLYRAPNGDWAVLDLILGKFTFGFDRAGQHLLYRQEDELIGWNPDGTPFREKRRSAEKFLEFVRARAAGRPASSDYTVYARPLKLESDSLSFETMGATFTATSYSMDAGDGRGLRWNVFPTGVNWTNTNTVSGAPNGGVDAIQAALAAWSNDCPSNVNYVYAGSDASKTGGLDASDNANTVIFERDLVNIDDYSCSTGGVIGIGGITSAIGTNMVSGETFYTILEGDVEMNRGLAGCTSFLTSGNFVSGMVHEIGHTLSFRHSNKTRNDASSCTGVAGLECTGTAIMNSTIVNGLNGVLQGWDQNGVRAIYPGGSCAKVRSDYDGNARADLFWRHSSGLNAIWFMNGATRTSAGFSQTLDSSWTFSGSGDFDGNGKADVIWRHLSSGLVAVWLMDGVNVSAAAYLPNLDSSWSLVGIGDFDGNGKSDLLFRHTSGLNAIWFMDGTTRASAAFTTTLDATWTLKAVGDFNGDGKSDLVWQHTSALRAVWLIDVVTVTAAAYLPTLDATWSVAASGDFNNDGRADLFLRHTSGLNAIWFMNGIAEPTGAFTTTLDPAWLLIASADYNGDGSADVVWRLGTTDTVALWSMTGVTVTGAFLPSIDASWVSHPHPATSSQ